MRDFSNKYCTIPPAEYSCMWSEIVQSYCKLYEHHDKAVTKRKEIWRLAQPKSKKLKYRQEFQCPTEANRKNIEIINKTDKTESTRTEQLAFPKLRHLTHLKSHPSFNAFKNVRKSGVNRLIRKSLLSVYSRLQNVTPEEKPGPPKAWNKENNSKLMKRLKMLALPKKNYSGSETTRTPSQRTGDGPKMKRLRKLSKPRVRKELEPIEWRLTNALKNYKPTDRLLKMSQPKRYDQNNEVDPIIIGHNALHYKATQRIKDLAEPAKNKIKIEEKPENPYQTNMRALKAIASKRVVELASPKEYADSNNREDAYRVSRSALKAKATTRLMQLAEPKKR